MPNIKSAIKRVKINSIKALENRMVKSALKTIIKKFDLACAGDDKQAAAEAGLAAVKAVDKAAAKGLIHKNNAAHKKSAIALKLNKIA